jgi:transcriptional regulator with XRE-family HTH domain
MSAYILSRMTNELPVWRAKRRISQRNLAKRASITADRYWRIENDHAEPTDAEIAALADALTATPSDLFPTLERSRLVSGDGTRSSAA